MWAFCQVCFCCPSCQHTGLLVTSITLGFFCAQLPMCEVCRVGLLLCLISTSWVPSQGCFNQVKSEKWHKIYVRGMCNILSSVPLQQKSEMADQCWSLVTAQFYLASKGKCILEAWGRTYPKEARGSILAPFFILFFFPSSPWACPV